MLATLRVRDVVLASWPADVERIARTLPAGLRPAEVEGRHIVSAATFRCTGGTLGRLPLPPFSQLNLHAYVEHRGEPGVVFLASRVTWPGMGGALLGAPYRPARIRVRPGRVEAPGLGFSLAYEPREPATPSPVTERLVGLYEAAGVRAFRVRRRRAVWHAAVPVGEVRADPLLALGFELSDLPALLVARRAEFQVELPPRRVS